MGNDSAQDILEKVIQAQGGAEKWRGMLKISRAAATPFP